MNSICKQYMEQIRLIFPLMGKQEKQYLQKMSVQVEDFCEENDVGSLDDLYKHFDPPEDVVREYFSVMDTSEIIRRIKRGRLFRILVICIIIAALAAGTAAITKTVLYQMAYQEAIESINGYWDETIE